MVASSKDLWRLASDYPAIDPADLTVAIEDQVRRKDLDFRSRLLIRDSLNALNNYWGPNKLKKWLAACPVAVDIEKIWFEDLGEPGFPSLLRRVMDTTRPETIRQLFRDLGTRLHLHRPLRIHVGGAGALILMDFLSRKTEDIDVVDEVPPEIRKEQKTLEALTARYNLYLAHFQSHYLPSGWDKRIHYCDTFGDLQVYLVDVYDIFLSKLFSIREKDFGDLKFLIPQLDKEILVRRFKETTVSFLASESLRQRAEKNWYILFGEPLPS